MPTLPPVKRFVSSTGARIYRIACPALPELTGRVYLVLGAGPATLVDAGIGEGDATRHILDGIATAADRFGENVRVEGLGRILLTHEHIDHIGGLAELARRSGAAVGAHPLAVPVIEAFHERAVLYNRRIDGFLTEAGVPAERRPEIVRTFGYAPDRCRSVPVDFLLEEDNAIDGLEFVHTPGHAAGHVCIRAGDVLLAGDHLLARTVPQQWPESTMPYTGLGHYIESLEKVRHLEGIALVLGGHEPPVHDVGLRIDEILDTHARRLDRLMGVLRDAPHPLSVAEMTAAMYADQEGFWEMLALMDVGSRVEHLDQRGRLRVANVDEIEGGETPVFRYRPA